MKATIFVAALFVFLVGCSSKQGAQLTQQQRDQIKTEVKAISDSIWARYQRLEMRSTARWGGGSSGIFDPRVVISPLVPLVLAMN